MDYLFLYVSTLYLPKKEKRNHRIFIHHKMIIKMVPSIGMIRFDSQRLIKKMLYKIHFSIIYLLLFTITNLKSKEKP